jgi:PLP dependent protein
MNSHTDSHHPDIREARDRVLERIADACARAGRDPAEVTLVAVTKEVEAVRIAEAVAAGLTTFGENRVQEAAAKIPGIEGARWHLVGPLQSNKARRAIGLFDVIETVDSPALARRVDRIVAEERPTIPFRVLLQVNVDQDPAKGGFTPDEVAREIDGLLALTAIDVAGLMTVGRQVETADQARPTFSALRELAVRLRDGRPGLGSELSMGMTDDFEVAIEEGATIVRIGRALFGERHRHD